MNPRKLLIALSVAVVPAIGFFLLPSTEEQIAMLVRDGKSEEALRVVEQLLVRGHKKPSLLAAAARLHDAADRPARAAEILEAYVKLRSNDPDAFEWLSRLHAASENTEGRMRAQARLVALQPTRERLSRLLGLYRLHGRFDEERETLLAMRRSPLLEFAELERLSHLLAIKGDQRNAITVLQDLDNRTSETSEGARLLLFDLLVSAGQTSEAASLGLKWIPQWRKPWLTMTLVRRIARTGRVDHVHALASSAVDLHPEMRFYLAKTLAQQGSRTVAARLLESWPTKASEPPPGEIAEYLAVAQIINDAKATWRKFAMITTQPNWITAQGHFAEGMEARFGLAAVASMRPALSPKVLGTRPLFAARLALFQGNRSMARWFLVSVNPISLSQAEKISWVELLKKATSNKETLALVAALRRDSRLALDLAPIYVNLVNEEAQRRSMAQASLLPYRLSPVQGADVTRLNNPAPISKINTGSTSK